VGKKRGCFSFHAQRRRRKANDRDALGRGKKEARSSPREENLTLFTDERLDVTQEGQSERRKGTVMGVALSGKSGVAPRGGKGREKESACSEFSRKAVAGDRYEKKAHCAGRGAGERNTTRENAC